MRGIVLIPLKILVHQDRQSLNLKYVFVNGVAGFVAKR